MLTLLSFALLNACDKDPEGRAIPQVEDLAALCSGFGTRTSTFV
jgi:hypothetical protein